MGQRRPATNAANAKDSACLKYTAETPGPAGSSAQLLLAGVVAGVGRPHSHL